MLSYLEYTSKDFAIEYICSQHNIDFSKFFFSRSKIKTVYPDSGQDLESIVRLAEPDLFAVDMAAEPFLIDLIDKPLPTSAHLLPLIHTSQYSYLTRSQKSLSSVEKKELKKAKLDLIELKKPKPQVLQDLLSIYTSQKNLNLTPSVAAKFVKNAATYTELIDLLDLYQLSDQDIALFSASFPQDEILPFMKGLNLQGGLSSMRSWYNIDSEQVQLHLSVMLSKLIKMSNNQTLVAELVKTDYTIKQVSGVSPLVWWKLFLYKINQK